jgi:hypothetical protein
MLEIQSISSSLILLAPGLLVYLFRYILSEKYILEIGLGLIAVRQGKKTVCFSPAI